MKEQQKTHKLQLKRIRILCSQPQQHTTMQALTNIRTLVTGATGFVGLRTVSKLLSDTPTKQIALAIRADSQKGAEDRLATLMVQHSNLGIQNHLDRVHVIAYDGTNIPVYGRDYDALLNLAADTSWTEPLDHYLEANCLPIAKLMGDKAVPKHVVHCSTTFAVPLDVVSERTVAEETSLPEGSSFFSRYAESKYHTERMIESNVGVTDTCYSIVRPAIVGASVGMDSVPRGWITDLKGLAGLLYATHPAITSFQRAPVAPKFDCNVIPVDHVANILIAALLENVVRNTPSIEYINAAPGHDFGISWADVIKSVNPSLPLVEDPSPSLPYTTDAKLNAAGEQLYQATGQPFRFRASKQERLLEPLLGPTEKKAFPMKWRPEDNVHRFFKDSADVVANMVAEKKAAKNPMPPSSDMETKPRQMRASL